jgi:AcrR family transcriptional regulator
MAKARIDEQALLKVALDEFSIFSFNEASINRIIHKAGISKGSFYYRFKTKYELYIHVLKEGSRKKWDFIRKEMENRKTTDEDIFSQFLIQTELGIGFASAFPSWHRLAAKFSREKGTEIYDRALKDLGENDQSGFSGMIDTALERGELNPRYSREFLAAVMTVLFQNYESLFPEEGRDDPEKIMNRMKELVRFMKYGLKNKAEKQN